MRRTALAGLLIFSALTMGQVRETALAKLHASFLAPPDDARIMMRWWWFGSAVTKPEIEREMRAMKEGGIGGFEIQPVYPLELDDPEKGFVNLPYLSDGYLDALKFTAQKARELGMRMDVTLGSGWPFGGPHTPITEAAGALRVDRVEVTDPASYVKKPSLANGERMMATFFAPGNRRTFEADGLRKIGEGSEFAVPAGWSGPHAVMFFISSRSGMQVKRPAVGAEGFVLDHYDRNAIEHHLKIVGERLLTAFGPNPPYSVFSDSLEVFASDWTPDLLGEFRRRRGYDLTPYLPALIGDIGEKTGSVRRDWGKTLTELCEERYLTPISEWAHAHHTKFRSQTYGVPPVVLSSNALVDLPEGEHGPAWREFSAARWASSASHLYGREVTSSETWTWLHSPAFRATPLDMKAEADLHFIQGINQFVGHGWAYSPASAGEPGWRFYAAAVFNEHNPWWIVMPDAARYFQRVSWLMRQGKPANDVAIYLPTDDAYAQFHAGQDSVDRSMDRLLGTTLIPQVLDAGYNFDFIDDGAIQKLGISHSVLILPNVERMPLATLRKIDAYAAKGGIVIATRRLPSMATGLQDAADTPQVRAIAASMKVHFIADELQTGKTLQGLLQPDFFAGSGAIGFNHRKLENADIYFVANTSNQTVSGQAAVRQKNMRAEWWDPFTGAVSYATLENLRYSFAPYESRILVISNESTAQPPPAQIFSKLGGGAPADWKGSWTDDPKKRYYSGTVTYETTIGPAERIDFGPGTAIAPTRMANGMRAWLDPPVREAATVYVNGQLAGYVWHPPFELDISKFTHAGQNQLKVVVANTAINELAGQALPDYKLLKLKYGDRFQPQDMENLQPLPSGILGNVTIW